MVLGQRATVHRNSHIQWFCTLNFDYRSDNKDRLPKLMSLDHWAGELYKTTILFATDELAIKPWIYGNISTSREHKCADNSCSIYSKFGPNQSFPVCIWCLVSGRAIILFLRIGPHNNWVGQQSSRYQPSQIHSWKANMQPMESRFSLSHAWQGYKKHRCVDTVCEYKQIEISVSMSVAKCPRKNLIKGASTRSAFIMLNQRDTFSKAGIVAYLAPNPGWPSQKSWLILPTGSGTSVVFSPGRPDHCQIILQPVIDNPRLTALKDYLVCKMSIKMLTHRFHQPSQDAMLFFLPVFSIPTATDLLNCAPRINECGGWREVDCASPLKKIEMPGYKPFREVPDTVFSKEPQGRTFTASARWM